MRPTGNGTTSNKRNSSVSSVGSSTSGQHQRKAAKNSQQTTNSKKKQQHHQHQQQTTQQSNSSNGVKCTNPSSPTNQSSQSLCRSTLKPISGFYNDDRQAKGHTNETTTSHKEVVASWTNATGSGTTTPAVANASEYPADDHRKQNHCEIEKRRRDKMNHYIMELASVIPSFSSNQSKYDKLTVLRMAVQHVKSLRSSLCSFSNFHQRPSFLSSGNLLKNLILQMASQEVQDNLFMVVTCDRGKVLFVSHSSKDILNQEQHELTGQCLFDMLHKDDVSKVKEQISYYSLMPREMLVDSKTLQKVKHNQRQTFSQMQNLSNSAPQPGARRSFFCRMRSGPTQQHLSFGTNIDSEQLSQTKVDNEQKQQQQDNLKFQDSSPVDDNLSSTCRNDESGDAEAESIESQQPSSTDSRLTSCISKSNQTDQYSNSKVILQSNDNNTDRLKENSEKICRKSSSSGSSTSSSSGAASMDDSSNTGRSDEPNTSVEENSVKVVDQAVGTNATSKSSTSLRSGTQISKKHLRYIVMHCTGYVKAITIRNDEFDHDELDYNTSENSSSDEDENESSRTINCLVAVCRRSPIYRDLKLDRPLTFTCRYSMEGKFVFADQRTTVALGYTPQQLLGTSHYAYCHKDSVNTFKECHRQCILKSEAVSSDIYQFKRANGQNLWLQTSLKSFRNPWTKFIDYIVASHTTAEGNEPHYNEGCIPTKFNQDMTGEAPQSSSPGSSSSLSLPSMDSKKSSSPSSSSIGSSYSMDSYASGGSIQALLNQIDRVKSGGIKHGPNFHRKKSDSRVARSDGSARKSNDDLGNLSDLQSCSSFSSQNSANLYSDFANVQGVTNFVDVNNQPGMVDQNSSNGNNNFYNSKSGQGACNPPNYQLLCQQLSAPENVLNNSANYGQTTTNTHCTRNDKSSSRLCNRITRPAGGNRQNQRQCNSGHYYYKNQVKSNSSLSSDTGNESAPLSNSSGSVYSDISHRGPRNNRVVEVVDQNSIKDRHQSDMCNAPVQEGQCQTSYTIQQVGTTSMNIEPTQVTSDMQGIGSCQVEDNYSNNLLSVNPYLNQDVNTRYNEGVDMNQLQQIQSNPQSNMTMTMSEHQQVQRSQQTDISNQMNVPMMWTTTENAYQNLNTIDGAGTGQMCASGDTSIMNMDVGNSNNQMIAQQTVHCQQCASYKCQNQQSMMNNNTDLNSINLTSLVVDGDLDEDQLLEYLAACEPDGQLYHVQNNSYPQYNSYR